MAAERITASGPIAYTKKWNSLITFVVSVLQDLKYISSEFIASSSHRREILEEKLAFVTDDQDVISSKKIYMDDQMKTVISRQYDMGADLKAILELLKQKP